MRTFLLRERLYIYREGKNAKSMWTSYILERKTFDLINIP